MCGPAPNRLQTCIGPQLETPGLKNYNSTTKKPNWIKNEQTIWTDISPKKTYTNGQAWEKMLNIINHYENINENHNEIPPNIIRMRTIKKKKKNQKNTVVILVC